MIVFISYQHGKRFATSLRHQKPHLVTLGKCRIERYGDGEIHASVLSKIEKKDCLVIGSTAPPDEQLLFLLNLTDALKRSGASRIRVFLPYLGYGRQDKFAPGESGGIALIGSLLKTTGVDEVISIDIHSILDTKLLGLPLTSIPYAQLFVPMIQKLDWDDITIVAPDEGVIERAKKLQI